MGDSEASEMWKEYRLAQKERRKARLPKNTDEILALRDIGYKVEQKTDFHFRINGILDLFPIHKRWHNIKTNKRGNWSKPLIAVVILQTEKI